MNDEARGAHGAVSRKPGEDHEVGYGRPPRHSQFKKGQSGNSRGRTKLKRTIIEIFRQVIAEKITVHQGGKAERITKGQAVLRINLQEALKGGRRAMDNLFRLANEVGIFDDVPIENRALVLLPEPLSAEEFQAFVDATNRASIEEARKEAELEARRKRE